MPDPSEPSADLEFASALSRELRSLGGELVYYGFDAVQASWLFRFTLRGRPFDLEWIGPDRRISLRTRMNTPASIIEQPVASESIDLTNLHARASALLRQAHELG